MPTNVMNRLTSPLASKPGVFETSREVIETASRTVDITYVKPVKPRLPIFPVVFATGDGGWKDTSKAIFEQMAERQYYLAGFDSRPIVAPQKKPGNRISIPDAALFFEKAYTHAKRALGLPETTPVIATGESRGASMVVFVSGEKHIRKSVAGGVAIALTREADYIKAPDPVDRPAGMAVDSKGRIQLYPVLEHIGDIPFAVIQSTNDGYVPSEEARRLIGPDTPTRRLYEVKARNHSFSGGRDELLKDLDAALDWVEANAAAR
jgi:hypothetical protein